MSSTSTAAWTAICPGSASGSTDGAPMPGSSVADRGQVVLGGVQHHVAAVPGGDDALEHQLEPVDELAPRSSASRFAISTASDESSAADPAQPVDARGRAGGDEVDDRLREAEARRRLDRARRPGRARPRRRPPRARRASRPGRRSRRAGRRGRRCVCCGAATGTAASSVQRAKPRSASRTTSACASATRFAPVMPRWTTPSWTYSGMSCGRTSSRSTGAFWQGTCSARSPASKRRPAAARSSSAGGAIRPFEGTATSRRPSGRGAHAASLAGSAERELVAAGAVAQPLRHARDGRRARVHALGDLQVRESLLEQPDDLPAMSERLQLAARAEVAEEPLRLVGVAQREEGSGELVQAGDLLDVMSRLARRSCSWRHVSMLIRCHGDLRGHPRDRRSRRPLRPALGGTAGARHDRGRRPGGGSRAVRRRGRDAGSTSSISTARSPGGRRPGSSRRSRPPACPVQVGGGLRDVDAMQAALDAGAARIIVGTAALDGQARACPCWQPLRRAARRRGRRTGRPGRRRRLGDRDRRDAARARRALRRRRRRAPARHEHAARRLARRAGHRAPRGRARGRACRCSPRAGSRRSTISQRSATSAARARWSGAPSGRAGSASPRRSPTWPETGSR